jgi:hypothetical protein
MRPVRSVSHYAGVWPRSRIPATTRTAAPSIRHVRRRNRRLCVPISRCRVLEAPINRNPAWPPRLPVKLFHSCRVPPQIEAIEILSGENFPMAVEKRPLQIRRQRRQSFLVILIRRVDWIVEKSRRNKAVFADSSSEGFTFSPGTEDLESASVVASCPARSFPTLCDFRAGRRGLIVQPLSLLARSRLSIWEQDTRVSGPVRAARASLLPPRRCARSTQMNFSSAFCDAFSLARAPFPLVSRAEFLRT